GRYGADGTLRALPVPRAVPAVRRPVADRLVEPDARRRYAGRLVPAPGAAHEVRPGLVAWAGRRATRRVHRTALDVPARGRLGDRVLDVRRPGPDGRPGRVPDRGEQRRVRLQL